MARKPFERNFGFLIHDVSRLMRKTFDLRIREIGLTRSRWRVLAHLMRRQGVTQSELAEELDVGKASLGILLEGLEKEGWVARRPDAQDRRVRRVYCTEKVEPILDLLNRTGGELQRQALSGLPKEQQAQLIDALANVKANLLALQEAPEARPTASIAPFPDAAPPNIGKRRHSA